MFLRSRSASNGIHWTFHARDKMRFYRLSEARVKRVMNSPKRVEEGVAPNTLAMMQPASTRMVEAVPSETQWSRGASSPLRKSEKKQEKWTQEIWVMTQDSPGAKGKRSSTKVISAWRYPGVSKPRSEVLKELMKKEYRDFVSTGR